MAFNLASASFSSGDMKFICVLMLETYLFTVNARTNGNNNDRDRRFVGFKAIVSNLSIRNATCSRMLVFLEVIKCGRKIKGNTMRLLSG